MAVFAVAVVAVRPVAPVQKSTAACATFAHAPVGFTPAVRATVPNVFCDGLWVGRIVFMRPVGVGHGCVFIRIVRPCHNGHLARLVHGDAGSNPTGPTKKARRPAAYAASKRRAFPYSRGGQGRCTTDLRPGACDTDALPFPLMRGFRLPWDETFRADGTADRIGRWRIPPATPCVIRSARGFPPRLMRRKAEEWFRSGGESRNGQVRHPGLSVRP